MKKIIVTILLSGMLLFCGCGADLSSTAADTEPQVSVTPESTPKPSVIATTELTPEPSAFVIPEVANVDMTLFKDIMKRVQKNIDTGTFEGFTKVSTFEDIAAADMELYSTGETFAVDFLGFPANVLYSFRSDDHRLIFNIKPDEMTDYEERISNVLDKLDDSLGRHTKRELNGGLRDYIWKSGKHKVVMTLKEAGNEPSDIFATILLEYPDKDISSAKFKSIFYGLFGVEYTEEHDNKMQDVLNNKEGLTGGGLIYRDKDITINFRFIRSKAVNYVFNQGEYSYIFDMTDPGFALSYMTACMDTISNIYGKPESCLYHSYDLDVVKTAEEVKQLGWDKFYVNVFWENGITMSIFYNGDTAEFSLSFDRRNF